MRKAALEILKLKSETEDLTRALKGYNSTYTAAAGSYRAMENEARSLNTQLKNLAGGMQADSAEAQALKARLAEVNGALISFGRSINDGHANVGRYAESIREAVGSLERQRTALLSDADALHTQAKAAGLSQDAQQKLQTELQQTEVELGKVEARLQGYGVQTQKSGGLTAGFVGELAGAYFSLSTLTTAFQQVFADNVKYSDEAASVQKTTGQTAEEFDVLADKLTTLNSRTSLSGLLKEAEIGGQLGVLKKDIADFVEGLDVSVAALEDDFEGGAEAIAKSLGTINTIFGKSLGGDLKTNLVNIGSALNELSGTGASTAPVLADVANRVGAVASNAGLGLDKVLGYADVLESLGYTGEVAGTSLNRLFNTLSTRREAAFNIAKLGDANLTLKQFTRLINTDFNGAITAFFRGLNAGGTSTTKLSDLLGTLKLQSGEARSVIISLAKNIDLVSERQGVASEQLRVGTSVAAEAEKKTNNLAGSWEKLKKAISSSVIGNEVSNFFKSIVDGANQLLSMGNFEKLQQAKSREIALSGEQIGANLRAANSGRELLAQYEKQTTALANLQANGHKPTIQQTRELDLLTLKLRDTFGDTIGTIDKETGAFVLNTAAVRDAIKQRLLLANQEASTAALRYDKLDQDEKAQKAIVGDLQRQIELRKQVVLAQDITLERARQLSALNIESQAEGRGGLKGFDFKPIDQYNEAQRQLSIGTDKLTAIQKLKAEQQAILNKFGFDAAKLLAGQTAATDTQAKATADDIEADKKKKQSVADVAKEEYELQKQRLQARITDLDRQADNPANTDAIRTEAVRKGTAARIELAELERKELTREAAQANKEKLNGDTATATARVRLTEAFQEQVLKATNDGDKKLLALRNALLNHLGELDKISLEGQITAAEKVRDDVGKTYAERQRAARQVAEYQIEIAAIVRDAEIRSAQGALDKIEQATKRYEASRAKASASVKVYDSQKDIDEQDASYARLLLATEDLHSKQLLSERQYLHEVAVLEEQREAEAIAALEAEYGETADVLRRKAALRHRHNERELSEEKEKEQKRLQIIQDSLQYAQTLGGALFDFQASRLAIQEQNEQASYEGALKTAGANLELKEQAEKDHIKAVAKLRYEQAKNERDQALFSIAISTAMAIAKSLAQFGLPLATPFIIADAAVGALQIAAVAARPLPKYFKGREGGPAEFAELAERGPELVGRPGAYRLIAKPSIGYLQAGEQVLTAPKTQQILAQHELVEGRLTRRIEQADWEQQTSYLRDATTQQAALQQAAVNQANRPLLEKLEQVRRAIQEQEYNRLNEQEDLVRRIEAEGRVRDNFNKRYRLK